MDNILLYNKLSSLPESLKKEVNDFIEFLLNKSKNEKSGKEKPKPVFGSGKGVFIMKTGFDEPIDDFNEYKS